MIAGSRDLVLRTVKNWVGGEREEDDTKRTPVFYPTWTGPWEIISHVSPVSVRIVDPITRRKPRTVHVQNIKPYLAEKKAKWWMGIDNNYNNCILAFYANTGLSVLGQISRLAQKIRGTLGWFAPSYGSRAMAITVERCRRSQRDSNSSCGNPT